VDGELMSEHRDIIDDHNITVERVRKLEIMPQRALVSSYWKPNRDELDAIAQHVVMLGFFRNITIGSMPPHSGPAAQYMWAKMQSHGFFPYDEIGQDWTRFLQVLGAFPATTAFSVLTMDGGTLPPGQPAPGGPYLRAGWGPHVPGVSNFPPASPWQRICYVAGFPAKGSWFHSNAGEPSGAVVTPDENNGGLYIANTSPPRQLIVPGAMRGTFEQGDPIIGRNNSYGFATQTDCGGPNEPKYNGYEYPGRPIGYDSGPQPCPKGNEIGAVFYGGGIGRVSLWLSDLDLFLIAPPAPQAPWAMGDNQLVSSINFVPWETGSFPGIDWLMDTIAMVLPDYPAVQAFYENVLPVALASVSHSHQALRLGPGWYGRIEMQIRDQVAVLRGGATCWTDQIWHGGHGGDIAAWPVRYVAGVWPEWQGYVLPQPPFGGTIPRFEGHLADGTPVPLLMTTETNGLRIICVDANWSSQWEADNQHVGTVDEITITFDGARIALDYP
jgi:hypothetical protein